MALSAKKIEQLRKTVGRYRDDGDGGVRGLYLSVPYKKGKDTDRLKPGGASWLLRFDVECEPRTTKNGNETNRRERWIGLGPLDVFSLKEARIRARAKRQLLVDHIDPLIQKKADKAAKALAAAKTITFKKAAEEYIDQNAAKWSNAKHAAQWASTLKDYAYPIIGNWLISDIDRAAILKVLEQPHDGKRLWNSIPETASRLRGRMKQVLDWGTARDYRHGDNPAAWPLLKHSGLSARSVIQPGEAQPALPYAEANPDYPFAPRGVASFVAELRKQKGIAALALEFLILTATRTGAVTGAKWEEIKPAEKVWIVPAGRAGTKTKKNLKPRYVPLSDRAIEILESLHTEENNPFVFIGSEPGKGLPDRAMSKLMSTMAFNSTTEGRLAVPHGFRSTFTDWIADETDYDDAVADQALWHVVGDKTGRAYRRTNMYKKRVQAMQDWARYVGTPPAEKSAKVVPIRKRGG